jgi:uncharacterized protein with HEPN domain
LRSLHDIVERMSLDAFKRDAITRRAAAYSVQTICEAVRRIPDERLAEHPAEPWAQIKGIGNRIRHEYFRLDDDILWHVMTIDTHSLKSAMQSLLARYAGEAGR